MKLLKTAEGNRIRMSQEEWEDMGKKAGWMKTAADEGFPDPSAPGVQQMQEQGRTLPTQPAAPAQTAVPPQPTQQGTPIDPLVFSNGLAGFEKYFINYFAKDEGKDVAKWMIALTKDPKFNGVTAQLQQLTQLMSDIYQNAIDTARAG